MLRTCNKPNSDIAMPPTVRIVPTVGHRQREADLLFEGQPVVDTRIF